MTSNNLHFTDLLSVSEAAELCRVSRITIHRWIQRGKLDTVHIGKSRFVLKRDIEGICAARDGADMDSRLRNILARRTPGWTFTIVGEPTDYGPNTMIAIGPEGERIRFRLEVLEESKSKTQDITEVKDAKTEAGDQ
jgi:excisionase family DNA binding protein